MKYVVYLDRLPYNKIEKLRSVIGTGEMGWSGAWARLPQEKKIEVGRVAFDCEDISEVLMRFERNVHNGHLVPVIIAQ